MCGISGFLWLDDGSPRFDATTRLDSMIAMLGHRGPDHRATWSDGTCGLAHARLSILDLSPAGNQPMESADGRHVITFNGEIYNFNELKTELEAKGFHFRTRTDTEVILNGYAAWGDAVLKRLRGMFAFALWDRAGRRLLLARDRFGKKPLVYTRVGKLLLFASELKAILTWPGFEPAIDSAAIDQFLTFQYVPAPLTGFQSIRKLPPAHMLAFGRDGGGEWRGHEPVRYWHLPLADISAPARPHVAAEHELVERLEEAVRLRMISDVPIGAFLSGGVDSSAVVALMARQSTAPIKTFSVSFSDPAFDESRYARMVAGRYGTDHVEVRVELDPETILPKLAWQFDDPFADPSMVPTYSIAQIASEHVKVVLTGDGGDEAFLGYDRYRVLPRLAQLARLPPFLWSAVHRTLSLLPAGAGGRVRQRIAVITELLARGVRRPSQLYGPMIAFFLDAEKQRGYGERMRPLLAHSALDELDRYWDSTASIIAGANRADLSTYLPDDLMTKVDMASMAHGLEARAPFLDHPLMEWAVTLPEDERFDGRTAKKILKRAMAPFLPETLLHRPKMGFDCPIGDWLRGPLKSITHECLLSRRCAERGIFEPSYVRNLLDEHETGRRSHHRRLWAMLILELWFQTWVEAKAGAPRWVQGDAL